MIFGAMQKFPCRFKPYSKISGNLKTVCIRLNKMKLNPEQLERLRKSFDKIGTFAGLTDTEIEKILNDIINFYATLGKINLRIKQEENDAKNKN